MFYEINNFGHKPVSETASNNRNQKCEGWRVDCIDKGGLDYYIKSLLGTQGVSKDLVK
jgi:hypothetical protein